MTDELHLRSGLPADFRYLEASYPRPDWPTMGLAPSALHWLDIHAWFRASLGDLTGLGSGWREGRLDAASYRAQAMPRLRQWLSHLHGHHNIESQHYFPAMAAAEPGMAKGFALLDRDHEAIDQLMTAMAQAAMALNRAAAEATDLSPPAADLAGAIEHGGALIGRHLWDEEEIVVPVLTLRGDPFDR